MSQIPSEQLLSSPSRLSRAASPDSTGQTIGVGYGSADMPLTGQVHSQGEQQAQQLESALAGMGGFVAHLGAIRQHETNVQNALDEKAQHQKDIIDQGTAVREARRVLPEWAEKIKNRQTPVPATSEDVPKLTDGIVEEETKYMSPAGKAAFRAAIEGPMDRLWYGLMDENRAIAVKETLRDGGDAMSKERTADGIKSIRAKVMGMGLNVTDDQADALVLNVAQTAAMAGDNEQFLAASSALGGRFPEQMQRAQNTLEVQNDKARISANRDFSNLAAAMATSEDRPVPYSIQRANLRNFAKNTVDWEGKPLVDDSVLRTQLHAIDSAEKNAANEERKRMAPIIHEQAMQASSVEAFQVLAAGRESGYGFAALRDVKVPNKEGTGVETVPVRKQADAARDMLFAQIDSNIRNPVENLSAKLDWLAGSGDPNPKYPQYGAQLNGAATMLSPAMTEKDVPRSAIDAFNAYETGLKLGHKTLVESQMEPDTRHFMSIAKLIHDQREGMSIPAALVAARIEGDRPPSERATPISAELAIKTLNSLGYTDKKGVPLNFPDIKNSGSMIETIRTLSLVNQAMGPMSPADAAALAGQQFKDGWANMGGYFVDRRARPVVDQIDKESVSSTIAEYFAKTHSLEGADVVKNLGIRPDDTGWSVAYLSPYWQSPIDAPRYSDHDLTEINHYIQNVKAIADHPQREKDYQAIAASEQTGGMIGSIARGIDYVGSAIGGVAPSKFKQAKPVAPLDVPAELRPNNPNLQGIFDFIKARSTKASKPVDLGPKPLFGPIRTAGT